MTVAVLARLAGWGSEVVVDAGCALGGIIRQGLGYCLYVLAMRSPGTCVGPFPYTFSGTP